MTEWEDFIWNWKSAHQLITIYIKNFSSEDQRMHDVRYVSAKPRGKMGVYSPSSHMQKLPSCIRSRISKAADNKGDMWSIFHFFRKLCCTVLNCCQPISSRGSNQGGRLSKHQHPCSLPHPPPVPTNPYYCPHQQQFLHCRDCQHPLLL